MNVIVNEDNAIGVASELYVAGRCPEEGTEIIRERFFLVLETDHGERLRHTYFFAEEERAERLAARVVEAGSINTENWSYMEPRYGSAAYVDQWCEQDQIEREKMAA